MYNYAENVVGTVGNSTRARVTVAAKNDVCISLGEDTSHECKKYEVVIGGSSNSESSIRYNNHGQEQTRVDGPVLCGYNNTRVFELDWSDGQNLKVFKADGQTGEMLEFMSCKLNGTQINTMSVATCNGSKGIWHVQLLL